jgi:hypothetical protein
MPKATITRCPTRKKYDQDSHHVDSCPRDLTVPLFLAEMRTNTEKKDSRTHGIDDWEKRYERNTHLGEKITCAFQDLLLRLFFLPSFLAPTRFLFAISLLCKDFCN